MKDRDSRPQVWYRTWWSGEVLMGGECEERSRPVWRSRVFRLFKLPVRNRFGVKYDALLPVI